MRKGFMKLFYELLSWEWFDNSSMVHLLVYFLLKANYRDVKWHGIDIPRGSFITSLDTIHKDTKISLQTIRTCINKLKSTGEITIKVTNKYSVITICKYDAYNQSEKDTNTQTNTQTNNQLTHNQQATNTQLTTDIEYNIHKNNNRNNNNIYSDEIENLRRENEELEHTPAADAKKEKVKKVSKTLGGRAREVWETFYNDLGVSDVPYYWTAKDAGQMKNILNALRFSREQKGMTATDDELLYALKYLLDSINDSWVMEHLSVATVFSKFNDIVAGAKAVKVKKENSDSSKYDEDGHPKVLIINGQVYR